MTDEEEFWSRVDRSDADGCWPWTGSVVGGRGRWRRTYAYRIAWELANGEKIPPGMFACHRCDNPICARPDHIFIGTARDNAHDAIQKGRAVFPAAPTGLANHSATVPPEVIAAAVAEYLRGGKSQAEMARRLGIAQSNFGKWVRAETRRDSGVDGVTVGKGRKSLAWGLKPCGTRAGYSRHIKARERPCEPCRQANLDYMRAYAAKRKASAA